ncbi:hypothetical protein GGI02_001387 [Coemansia sp. RSA 2322]|nr:hypothetical protein GGI02_001387 [Coemansia sp. RSA 2322]
MSQLNVKVAVWNPSASSTNSRATAVTACEDGVAVGHADGKIWLYGFSPAQAGTAPGTAGNCKRGGDRLALDIRPKCLLGAHHSAISLLHLGQISSPANDGSEGTIASVSEDGDVVLWGVSDGRCIAHTRTPLYNIRPTLACLQTVDYQSAAEDLLFVGGEGPMVYVLSYPSLDPVYEWTLPHSEWVTALAVRKRRDHFRSELITCTSDGAVRLWSFDEFALAQQDVFSRAGSPVLGSAADNGLGANGNGGSRAESISSDTEAESSGGPRGGMFCLESTFPQQGETHVISSVVVNPFNDDEFLAVSPTVVRLFASRDSNLHELLRWKAQRSTSAPFTGAGFLAKADIVLWDALGNITSVCSSFAVQGGSAGMHVTRSLHREATGKLPVYVTSSLTAVPVRTESDLGQAAGCDGKPLSVLAMYAGNGKRQSLSVVLPVALSSVSGSANRPHENADDAKGGPKNWLGQTAVFDMGELWRKCMGDMQPGQDVTSVLVTECGSIALGFSDGTVRITLLSQLLGVGSARESVSLDLRGHASTITALYEWNMADSGGCSHCRRSMSADTECRVSSGSAIGTAGLDSRSSVSSKASTARKCAACSPNMLVSASADLTLKIWDMDSGECLNTLTMQSAPVMHLCSAIATRRTVWQESGGHHALKSLLRSLVLAVGSDNSTTLVSMESLERIYASAAYHERAVRLSLCKDTGGLVLHYADETKRSIVLEHMLAQRGHVGPVKAAPSYSISLVPVPSRAMDSGGDSSNGVSSGYWASVHLLTFNGRGALARCGVPAGLVVDVDVTQLQAAVSRVVPEGASRKQVQELLDSEALDLRAGGRGQGISSSSSSRWAQQPLRTSLGLLSVLCSWGVCAEVDATKADGFGMRAPASNVSLGISSKQRGVDSVQFPGLGGEGGRAASWCVSGLLNAQRMLGVLVLSRGILQGNEKRAVEIINFYVGKLPGEVGSRFKALSLLTLAQYWQSSDGNLQRAARTLILSTVHARGEQALRAEVFYWSSQLAAAAGVARGPAEDSDVLSALTIVCVIGADYPWLVPLTARSTAAGQLQALVAGERGGERARMVAMELVSRGFGAFAAHVDTRAVVRRLLAAMMAVEDDGGAVSFEAVVAAKSALLRMAAADMTAVSGAAAAILADDGEGVRERRGALQLVALLALKSAARLRPHVARVAAAIVQAIEPKRATARRLVIGAAGAALQGLVRAFPAVAFHAASQCLAVGADDGTCTTYDLRSATRTAVYDGGGRVAAVAISPQGDRVASFAVPAGVLSVWDPAPSALAMFARSLLWPAADAEPQPPGSVAPTKTMAIPPAYLHDAHEISLAWTADRTVLLQIQGASFSLSI